jgi:hypothetical protein
MATASQHQHHDDGVDAAFMRNHRGEVCIAFSDPAYVRAETILVDCKDCSIHAVLHENAHLLGHVSEGMAEAFVHNREALLTAMRADGTVFEMIAPVHIENGKVCARRN